MIIRVENSENIEKPLFFEFQGEFENIDCFNGEFDTKTLRMMFPGFYLEGKIISKKLEIYETEKINNEYKIKHISSIEEVILFDKAPKYIMNTS